MEKPYQLLTGRASRNVVRADRHQEDNAETLIAKQAKWLSHRLGVPADLARLVAELAFNGRPA